MEFWRIEYFREESYNIKNVGRDLFINKFNFIHIYFFKLYIIESNFEWNFSLLRWKILIIKFLQINNIFKNYSKISEFFYYILIIYYFIYSVISNLRSN